MSCSSRDNDDQSPLFESASSPDVSCDESDPLMVEHDAHVQSKQKKDAVVARNSSSSSSSTIITAECMKRWLQCYVRFTATAGNQDKLLKLLQWSLWMLGAGLAAAKRKHPHAAAWLHKLYGEVSFARYVTRLLGLPMALEAAVNDSWTSTSNNEALNRIYKVIGKVLAYSMVAYHPAELMAYVMWMKPKPPATTVQQQLQRSTPKRWPTAETWSYISCRFWLAYVVAELVQCVLQWRELRSQKNRLLHGKKTDTATTEDECGTDSVVQLDAQIANTLLQAVRDALFLIPCLQWSLPSWDTHPMLPVSTIHSLMWVESIACLYQAVKNAK